MNKDINESMRRLQKLAKRQMEAAKVVEEQEEELKKAKKKHREIAETFIPEAMEQLGLEKYVTTDGLEITVVNIIRANISKDRKLEALEWLRSHGHGKLIKNVFSVLPSSVEEVTELQTRLEGFDVKEDSTVHASTLKSFMKGMLERGENIPLELFGVHSQRSSKIKVVS